MTQLPLIALTLLVLSSSSAYAEWVSVSSSESLGGYTAYLDPDTIRRKGHLVKEWELYDFKTIQTLAGKSHLSLKMQHEYDCTKERSRELSYTLFSGSMGKGNVVSTDSHESNWNPLEPESIAQDLWKLACGKK
ncbi:MAG: surface-adhesin E family protein [Nitrospira sp.]